MPKKGDKDSVNNYRGIILTSVFSKIFSNILDTRLCILVENYDVLTDMQFGFRQGKSSVDCVFILHSMIQKIITTENRKMYCAFVDFKKAFDLIYRNGIWYKLLVSGVSSKFVCVCIPILVTTFSEWLSGTEPLPHTLGAVCPSLLCL